MTDRHSMGSRCNLSLQLLLEKIPQTDATFLAAVQTAVANAVRLCQPFRDDRNTRIAHSDLPSSMKASFVRPSRQSVLDAIKSIADAMNVLNSHYGRGEYRYLDVIFAGGGDALACYLRAGVHFFELQRRVDLDRLSGQTLVDEIHGYR